MDEDVKEMFDMFHAGEIDGWELYQMLEDSRFDGDILDFL